MRKKLLVVDDDPLFIDFVKEVFAAEEIDVISSPDGRAALSLIKNAPPSFILSDFEMPEMNGIKLHTALSEDHATRDIPFFFMTGSSDPDLTLYAEQRGVEVFYKTDIVRELLRLLEKLKEIPPTSSTAFS